MCTPWGRAGWAMPVGQALLAVLPEEMLSRNISVTGPRAGLRVPSGLARQPSSFLSLGGVVLSQCLMPELF